MIAAYGIIDPDYARIFTKARCLAWAEGYAIMMHGSFTRDLDLLAVPWTERATEPEHLVNRIAGSCDLKLTGKEPGRKPHGRLAWTLLFPEFGDARFVDLSVMPRLASSPAEAEALPAGVDARATAAFLRISAQRRDVPDNVRQQMLLAASLLAALSSSAPAPEERADG